MNDRPWNDVEGGLTARREYRASRLTIDGDHRWSRWGQGGAE